MSGGVPQRRPWQVDAILGHGGRSVHWCRAHQSLFFLHEWRIFDLDVGGSINIIPSGKFPGGGVDVKALRSVMTVGEEKDPIAF